MKSEIELVVEFLIRFSVTQCRIPEEKITNYKSSLFKVLLNKYRGHWYVELPQRGQAYRCLRINSSSKEPSIHKAAKNVGIEYEDLCLPTELTIWVDPMEVSCRFGEHKGSYCTIASIKNGIEKIDIVNVLDNGNESEDGNDSFEVEQVESRKETTQVYSNPSSGSLSPTSVDQFMSKSGNQSPVSIDQHMSGSISPLSYTSSSSGYVSPPTNLQIDHFIPRHNVGYMNHPVPAYGPSSPLVFPPGKLHDYKVDLRSTWHPGQQYSFVPMSNNFSMTAPNELLSAHCFVPNFVNNWVHGQQTIVI